MCAQQYNGTVADQIDLDSAECLSAREVGDSRELAPKVSLLVWLHVLGRRDDHEAASSVIPGLGMQ